ncbi:hypothetical protein [Sporosarcina cyprini]|uniref:hypothetical protein n=1 Tax=Sporosarcina cyprini TaxID=2910523 RepID=UPI001EDEFC94|nr:hypothetical protein [Sporosarcina cyprini]MCG3088882.1 hypothetical protein [Sporosarcina cyprini]
MKASLVTSGMNEYTRGSQNIRAVTGIYEWFQNYFERSVHRYERLAEYMSGYSIYTSGYVKFILKDIWVYVEEAANKSSVSVHSICIQISPTASNPPHHIFSAISL